MTLDEIGTHCRQDIGRNCMFLNDIYLLDHLRRPDKTLNLAENPQKYLVLFIDINLSSIAKMI